MAKIGGFHFFKELYKRFCHNNRHKRYPTLFNQAYIRDVDDLGDSEKEFLVTDCSNCMLCRHRRVQYFPLNSLVVDCTHPKANKCNSVNVTDSLLTGTFYLYYNEYEVFNIDKY